MSKVAKLQSSLGRRERSTAEKRQRILDAATALFEERGFDAVTTQEISARADIAVGTLFRYAATKNDLLLLVYNEKLRQALERGAERGRRAGDLLEAIMEMILPMVELASAIHTQDSWAYQRELLFGAPDGVHRAEGLALIAGLQEAIAARLAEEAQERGLPVCANAVRLAASTVFAATHLVISRSSTGAHCGHDPKVDLRDQVRQIVLGLFATLASQDSGLTQQNLP